MMHRTLIMILLVVLSCAVCFGQTEFHGLTPGKSTRADVERVLGQPVNKVSETLVEYAPPSNPDPARYRVKAKVYVQYRKGSSTVERIAVLVNGKDEQAPPALYWQSCDRSYGEGWQSGLVDAKIEVKKGTKTSEVIYIGDPLFAVYSFAPPPYTYD